MLEQILEYINNWFIAKNGVYDGVFTVENGGIVLPFLVDGQYFRIIGSIHNDGLYQYPTSDLIDEEFSGTIWALAIPKALIKLSEDITEFEAKNQPSNFISESFGGYTYTKATDADGTAAGWQTVFKKRLNKYRKICNIPPSRSDYNEFT